MMRANDAGIASGQSAPNIHSGAVRRLFAAEEEALLGFEEDFTNHIAKVPEQSLAQRQLRRHSLLARAPPVRMLAFILSAMVAAAQDGNSTRWGFSDAFFSEAGNLKN